MHFVYAIYGAHLNLFGWLFNDAVSIKNCIVEACI